MVEECVVVVSGEELKLEEEEPLSCLAVRGKVSWREREVKPEEAGGLEVGRGMILCVQARTLVTLVSHLSHYGRTLNRGEEPPDDLFGASPSWVHRLPLGLLHNPNRSKSQISGALFRKSLQETSPQWLVPGRKTRRSGCRCH